MSSNAAAAPTGSHKRPPWLHPPQSRSSSYDIATAGHPGSPASTSTHSTVKASKKSEQGLICRLAINESFAKDEILLNLDRLGNDVKPGTLWAVTPLPAKTTGASLGPRNGIRKQAAHVDDCTRNAASRDGESTTSGNPLIFVAKDMPPEIKARIPDVEIYIVKNVAKCFGLKRCKKVFLSPVDDEHPPIEATHVELSFRDQYISRADMWRLAMGELAQKTVYKGQSVLFMGTIKAQITAVYVNGKNVYSAFFSTHTRPIFRSESARYILFIQMSREMWDFDSESSGEIMFDKVVNGFLPAMFKRWANLKVKHLVSVVLFARVEYDTGLSHELANNALYDDYYTGVNLSGNCRPYKDFYRVVINQMASGEWTRILYQLKRELNFFRRDISLHHHSVAAFTDWFHDEGSLNKIKAESSLAVHGNVLEAISMAASQFARDYIDRDLTRTGISIAVLTPGPGIFEVDYETLTRTTDALVSNGIGIDLICLPRMPLHSVPLFRYRNPHYSVDKPNDLSVITGRSFRSHDTTPFHHTPVIGSFQSTIESLSPSKGPHSARRDQHIASSLSNDEWCYALPQWLHISFWTGDTDEALSFAGIVIKASSGLSRDDEDEFNVRCRMYDLQMRSVLDANEIEAVPLKSDETYQEQIHALIGTSTGRQGRSGNASFFPNRRVVHGLKDPISGFRHYTSGKSLRSADGSMRNSMQDFDDKVCRFSSIDIVKSHPRPIQSKGRMDLDEVIREQAADDRGALGTSLPELKSIPKSQGQRKLSASVEAEGRPKFAEKSPKPLAISRKRSPPKKSAKLMRQISLGQRGFGIAAPKAALAEVKAETVEVSAASSGRSLPDEGSRTLTERRPTTAQTIVSHGSPISTQMAQRPAHDRRLQGVPTTPSIPIAKPERHDRRAESSTQVAIAPSMLQHQMVSRGGHDDADDGPFTSTLRAVDAQRVYKSKLRAGAGFDLSARWGQSFAKSPWLSLLNPFKPDESNLNETILYSRWQHVFPRPHDMRMQKWKTLCCPASVPLTTEHFPSKTKFDTEYQRQPYTVDRNIDDDLSEEPKSREDLMNELISVRFSQGFQVVVGPAVAQAFGQKHIKLSDIFARDQRLDDGTSIFMSVGNTIHQLSCVNGTEVEVNIFVRNSFDSALNTPSTFPAYRPAIRTLFDSDYESRKVDILIPKPDRNWNTIDSYIAGHRDEMTENLRFWRARFVLIPLSPESPSNFRTQMGDNPEELRIEGIKRLAQLWQKHRHFPPAERRFHSLANYRNPLDIIYKTEDPSIVVAAELETLSVLENQEGYLRKGKLMTRNERFQKSHLNLADLAEAMQQPIEHGGVPLRNRRWHLRLHSAAFIGSDMTTWLLDNFEDLEDREEAEQLGNALMVPEDAKGKERDKEHSEPIKGDRRKGLFVHVEKRHRFRDGNYFYQMAPEYAKPLPGWFSSKRRDTSVPPTPVTEFVDRDAAHAGPLGTPTSLEGHPPGSATAMTAPYSNLGARAHPRIVLSKSIKFDLDPRKRSYRPEIIDLHYDRLHNPDNCFHIRVDWMNTTSKLVRDAVDVWERDLSQYGLRLVEVPIDEACMINKTNPFRRPYGISLAVRPPDEKPNAYYDPNSLGPQTAPSKHFYQTAILKTCGYVLDLEAASNFPSNVDVRYSWGKPSFQYTQYIHRSGSLLAQINDEGNFLVLANRLCTKPAPPAPQASFDRGGQAFGYSTSSTRKAHELGRLDSPIPRPDSQQQQADPTVGNASTRTAAVHAEAESLKDELEAFCHDVPALEAFYRETLEKGQRVQETPSTAATPSLAPVFEAGIPALGLPPGVLGSPEGARSGAAMSSSMRLGSPLTFLRRTSVQHEGLGFGPPPKREEKG